MSQQKYVQQLADGSACAKMFKYAASNNDLKSIDDEKLNSMC